MKQVLRAILAAFGLLLAPPPPAFADSYARLLDVRCEPAIQVFSVRETGTWRFDGPFGDFIPIDRGAKRTLHASETTAAEGDLMAQCDVGTADRPIVFEVRRVGYLPPDQGQCRGAPLAAFAVTLNGAELARWSDGYAECASPNGDLPPAEGRSVSFDGDYVDICGATASVEAAEGRTLTIACRSRSLDQTLQNGH